MKKIIVITLIFLSQLSFSQEKTKLQVKKISFIQKHPITNLNDYKEGFRLKLNEGPMAVLLQGFVGLFDDFITEEDKIKYKKKEDSLINNVSVEQSYNDKITYYYEFVNDSIISRYQTHNSSTENYTTGKSFINTKLKRAFSRYPYPFSTEPSYRITPFTTIKNLKIEEFRNDKMIIKGISSFKIKCSYDEIHVMAVDDEDLPFLKNLPDVINHKESEIWVTEEIKSMYHPVFNVKEILERYYPLEISEKGSDMRGFMRTIELEELVL